MTAVFKTYDKQGNIDFDSQNITFGLIKSSGLNRFIPNWLISFFCEYEFLIFGSNKFEQAKQIWQSMPNNEYIDVLDIEVNKDLPVVRTFRLLLRSLIHEFISRERIATIKNKNNVYYLGFFNDSIQNNPRHELHEYIEGKFISAFNSALDDGFFGEFKTANDRKLFIDEFVNKYPVLKFVREDYYYGGLSDDVYTFYVDVIHPNCPTAFVCANGAWHSNMNFEWSKTQGGFPLVGFLTVKHTGQAWRFIFTSNMLLSDKELSRFRVYFFDLYHQKATVGLNMYKKTGELVFSSAQPPLKVVNINIPVVKDLNSIVAPERGWSLNRTKDVGLYHIDNDRLYAVLCSYGVSISGFGVAGSWADLIMLVWHG